MNQTTHNIKKRCSGCKQYIESGVQYMVLFSRKGVQYIICQDCLIEKLIGGQQKITLDFYDQANP